MPMFKAYFWTLALIVTLAAAAFTAALIWYGPMYVVLWIVPEWMLFHCLIMECVRGIDRNIRESLDREEASESKRRAINAAVLEALKSR